MTSGSARLPLAALIACVFVATLASGLASGASPVPATSHRAHHAQAQLARYVAPDSLQAKEFSLVQHGGLFHLFYMRRYPDSLGETNLRSFGHAVSTNLRQWTELDTVIAVRPGAFDADHVWSPSLVQQNGTWYMFYTGVKNVPYGWPYFQQIGVATSTDLLNWTRYPQPVYSGAMVPWTVSDSSSFAGSQFRDAFVMPDPADATQWLMYYVTIPTAVTDQLIVGVARNAGGLSAWNDIGTLWVTDAAHYFGWSESPVLMQHDSLWYMFMTTTSGHCIRYCTTPDPTADSTLWNGPYRLFDNAGQDSVSDAWFGPEVLSADGHDYISYVDANDGTIGFKEIIWGSTPTNFTLQEPTVASVPPAAPPGTLALTALGRPGAGRHVMFRITSPRATDGRLELFDLAGRRLDTVRTGALPAGDAFVEWDGRARGGRYVSNEIYFARLLTPLGTRVVRMVATE